jgi:hypothetical protein
MITQEQFQELLSFEPTDTQVLSLYLSTDSGLESIEAIKLKAKNLDADTPPPPVRRQGVGFWKDQSLDIATGRRIGPWMIGSGVVAIGAAYAIRQR